MEFGVFLWSLVIVGIGAFLYGLDIGYRVARMEQSKPIEEETP